MTRHEEIRFMPYSAAQMFEMISDITKYPEFIPWVQAARYRREWQDGDVNYVDADLVVAFLAFRERFGSRVAMNRRENAVDVDYLDGPFKRLNNHWRFVPTTGGTDVHFSVEFEFRSRILERAIGQVFDTAMRRIINAFEERAKVLYG